MKLSELGEFGLIDRIRRIVGEGEGVRRGIGEDCAALQVPAGHLLLTTTDLLIEEIHFRRRWTDFYRLGRKSAAVNISDIAAMGGIPRYLYLGLGLPGDLRVEDLDFFMAGFLDCSRSHGAALVGGDTCGSPGPLFISVTAEGSVPEEEMVGRQGARPGDLLYVSGTLGDSALALRILQGDGQPEDFLSARHHDPVPRVKLGRALASAHLPTAMIDLSDGLLSDLGHILEASGVGAHVETGRLPLSESFRRLLGADSGLLELALTGGEDYELLFCIPPQREAEVQAVSSAVSLPLTCIGEIRPGGAGMVVTQDGKPFSSLHRGHEHFRR